jgi:hypothetical protein
VSLDQHECILSNAELSARYQALLKTVAEQQAALTAASIQQSRTIQVVNVRSNLYSVDRVVDAETVKKLKANFDCPLFNEQNKVSTFITARATQLIQNIFEERGKCQDASWLEWDNKILLDTYLKFTLRKGPMILLRLPNSLRSMWYGRDNS